MLPKERRKETDQQNDEKKEQKERMNEWWMYLLLCTYASMYKNRRMKQYERKTNGSYQGWLWSKKAIYLKCN